MARLRQDFDAWWPFAVLCLIGATRWMLAGAWPQTVTTLSSEFFGTLTAALLCFATSKITRRHALSASDFAADAFAGAMLLAGPVAGLFVFQHSPNADALVIALALVPVVLAVAQNALSKDSDSIAGRLWPGLAAAAGLLLLLPQPSLSDPVTDAALLFTPLLTGAGAAFYIHSPAPAMQRIPAALCGAAFLFAPFCLGDFAFAHTFHFSASATALDAATAALTLLALARLGALRWSSQFALVPLAVVLEGLALLRPHLVVRTLVAVALLAMATLRLLLPQASAAEE